MNYAAEIEAMNLELAPSPRSEYKDLQQFYRINHLEITEEDPIPTDLVQSWKVVPKGGGALVGAVTLALRQGEYIIDGIAVEESRRKTNIGRALLAEAVGRVRDLGGKRIYLVARAPGFFRTQGFATLERELAPNFFECATCPQYGVDCRPEVMWMEV